MSNDDSQSEYEYGTDTGMGVSSQSLDTWAVDPEEEKQREVVQSMKDGTQYTVSEKTFLPATTEVMAMKFLNEMQSNVLSYCVARASALSKGAEQELEARLFRLGYKDNALRDLQLYIRDQAPIIIHVRGHVVSDFLLRDKYYRNMFEVPIPLEQRSNDNNAPPLDNVHGGNARVDWEDSMFNKLYHRATPFQRVKYGCLNISRDPAGVQCAYGYGDCYLQLRNIRLRTTFAAGDTGSSSFHQLAMCEYYTHILSLYSDADLKLVMDVVTNKVPYCSSAVMSQYKEIQIHGPVKLDRDVEALVVSEQSRPLLPQLREFTRKNNIALRFMDGTEEKYDYATEKTTIVRWLDQLPEFKPAVGGLGVVEHLKSTEDHPALFRVEDAAEVPSTAAPQPPRRERQKMKVPGAAVTRNYAVADVPSVGLASSPSPVVSVDDTTIPAAVTLVTTGYEDEVEPVRRTCCTIL